MELRWVDEQADRFFIFDGLTALDLVGPFDAFAVATELASSRENGCAYDRFHEARSRMLRNQSALRIASSLAARSSVGLV